MKKHISYSELGKKVAKDGWGMDCDWESAIKSANRESLSMYLLAHIANQLKLVEQLEPVVDILKTTLEAHAAKRASDWYVVACNSFRNQMHERENTHGTCPIAVDRAMRIAFFANVFRRSSDYFKHGYISTCLCPPEKGMATRREYDLWMKRKAKPEREKGA